MSHNDANDIEISMYDTLEDNGITETFQNNFNHQTEKNKIRSNISGYTESTPSQCKSDVEYNSGFANTTNCSSKVDISILKIPTNELTPTHSFTKNNEMCSLTTSTSDKNRVTSSILVATTDVNLTSNIVANLCGYNDFIDAPDVKSQNENENCHDNIPNVIEMQKMSSEVLVIEPSPNEEIQQSSDVTETFRSSYGMSQSKNLSYSPFLLSNLESLSTIFFFLSFSVLSPLQMPLTLKSQCSLLQQYSDNVIQEKPVPLIVNEIVNNEEKDDDDPNTSVMQLRMLPNNWFLVGFYYSTRRWRGFFR
jgi:hypothetical protein